MQLLTAEEVAHCWEKESVLTGMSVGGLAGHLARSVLQVEWFLDGQVVGAEPVLPVHFAAGFGISESTGHACTSAVIHLLVERAPGLLKVLREADADFVLLDGTLAECDRGGDGRADYSHKHRRHGVTSPR